MKQLRFICAALIAWALSIAPAQAVAATIWGGPAFKPSAGSAVATSRVLKPSSGLLFGFNVTSGASAGYVLLLDAAADPGNGAVTPKKCFVLGANTSMTAFWDAVPIAFTNGIVVIFSTTGCFTETQSATAFISGEVQ